jgi:hypothetical protein
MRYVEMLLNAVIAGSLLFSAPLFATETTTITTGGLRISLHLLPAEPFFTAEDTVSKHPTQGMLIMGGEAPVSPIAETNPNHHLVVHVFDAKSGKAITDAIVTMSFIAIDAKGKPRGNEIKVPVVIMQAIGKGAESTHYGNNVSMAEGKYAVTVSVNGKKTKFTITVSDAKMQGEHDMHDM